MAIIQSQRWCGTCGKQTLHARPTFSNTLGCLLTVLTAGIFIPIWLIIGIVEALTVAWRCQVCGKARVT